MNQRISVNEVYKAAERVLSGLPEFWRQFRRPQLRRVCEEISWIYVKGGTVVDLGGGPGFHASICACLGMRSVSVDNFKLIGKGTICDHFIEHNLIAEKAASALGVQFIHTNVLDWDITFEDNSIDVVMSFDTIEHLSRSPRRLYKRIVQCLKPQGLFLLGGPNAANLLKRIRVLLGENIFSRMDEWYMHDNFIGHVREPIVSDLKFLVKDLDLTVLDIVGRNWLGLHKLPKSMSICGNAFDRMLRCFPCLCSDIYLLAQKS
jgi:SAM-dependent methyltransferase